MSEPKTDSQQFAGLSREETHSLLFVQLILQQSNMAMMLLGKSPDPRSGQTVRDLDAAQMFIDQLEALEAKTKGNLTKAEEGLLKQTLMTLRLAFVEAVESPPATDQTAPAPPPADKAATPASGGQPAVESGADLSSAESSAKRFSKKYPT